MDYHLYGIKQLVTCPQCECFLESPISLPCANIICESHVKNFGSSFECVLCSVTHEIPKEGYKIHEKVDLVLRMQEHLNEDEKRLNEEIDRLITELVTFSNNLKNVKSKETLIYEDLAKLRNKIDLDVEILKNKLDDARDKMLKTIDDVGSQFAAKKNDLKDIDTDNAVEEIKQKWNIEKRRPYNLEENKNYQKEIERKVERIVKELGDFEASIYEHLSMNYVSKLDADKSLGSDEMFGILEKNVNASLPLDMFPEAKYSILFSATVCSNLTIVQNEKTGYKVSLDNIIDVIYKSVSFNPELLKAVEILDQVTEPQENILRKSCFGLRFATCLTKYLDWNNRKTLQLHALSILYKIFNQLELEEKYSIIRNGILSKIFKLLSNQNLCVASKAALLLAQTSNFNFHFDVRNYLDVYEIIERLVQLIKKKPNIECLINLTQSFSRFWFRFKSDEFDSCTELLAEIIPIFENILLNETDHELLNNILNCFIFLLDDKNKNEKLINILLKENVFRRILKIIQEKNDNLLSNSISCIKNIIIQSNNNKNKITVTVEDLEIFKPLLTSDDIFVKRDTISFFQEICALESYKDIFIEADLIPDMIKLFSMRSNNMINSQFFKQQILDLINVFVKNSSNNGLSYILKTQTQIKNLIFDSINKYDGFVQFHVSILYDILLVAKKENRLNEVLNDFNSQVGLDKIQNLAKSQYKEVRERVREFLDFFKTIQ